MLCSDCPPVDYPTDETRCDACPRSSRNMLRQARELAQRNCTRCNGTGWLQGRPASYETDTSEEMALAWDMARYPCPECKPRGVIA